MYKQESNMVYLFIYVNNIVISDNNEAFVNKVIQYLGNRREIRQSQFFPWNSSEENN